MSLACQLVDGCSRPSTRSQPYFFAGLPRSVLTAARSNNPSDGLRLAILSLDPVLVIEG